MKWTLLIVAIATLTSCGKKCPCEDETTVPAYIGYSLSQVDTIIIKKFAQGSNFSQRVDSFALTSLNAVFSASGDTIHVLGKRLDLRVTGGYDYQVINPFDNRTIQVSDIVIQKQSQNCGGLFSMDKQACFSPIVSFKLNGVATSFNQNSFDHALFIRK